ncbi:hypothetical protein [Amycolatopsis sp. NPDC004378]
MTEPSEDDLREMRDMMLGVIDFAPADDELRTAWTNPRLVSLAREWGWGDTELRDELAAELEQIRRAATASASAESSRLEFRVGRQQKILDPDSKSAIHIDEAALRRSSGAPGSKSEQPQPTSTYSGAEQHEQADAGVAAERLDGEGDAMEQIEPGAGAHGDVAVPAGPAPSTPVTVLLIVLLAVAGGAAIVLLTGAHQLWAGLACAVVAVAALWAADRRLRRRAEIRRLAGAAEGEDGQGRHRSPGPEGRA